jgi:hypothetical protein
MRNYYAHRVAYELFVGPVPDGMFVCHRCDNPPCCNPAHLFIGTAKDNAVDSSNKERRSRQRITHCKLGHEFTAANTRVRVNGNGRRECRECMRLRNARMVAERDPKEWRAYMRVWRTRRLMGALL